jgi:hypothetical protein
VREFYRRLSRRRAWSEGQQEVAEYIESYRHLREHGNAFLIILMEVILAAALYAANTTVRFFLLVIIWIVPAAFIWTIGTWLEVGL